MIDLSENGEAQSSGTVECKKKREQKKKQRLKSFKTIIFESRQGGSAHKPTQHLDTENSKLKVKSNRRKIRKKTEKSDVVDAECSLATPSRVNQGLLNQMITGLFIDINDMIISSTTDVQKVSTAKQKSNLESVSVCPETTNMVDKRAEAGKTVQGSPGAKVPGEKKRNKSVGEKGNAETRTTFDEYMSCGDVTKGLEDGSLFSGPIRINPKDFRLGYVTNPSKHEQDFLIESVQDRNRALDGDVVVVKLKDESEWRSPNQKLATVVCIKEMVHARTAIGTLKLMPDKNKRFACFHPRDSRVPRIKIPFTDWPPLFYEQAGQYEQVLFLCKITAWTDCRYAVGTVVENVGMSGDIKAETKAILVQNCLDTSAYGDQFNQYFPRDGSIAASEYRNRLDLRAECLFTIDPLTARDLDDAMSCKVLPNGNFEVGVHISDVSHYLAEGTPLDETVAQRGTSVYMVEAVYHMLPKEMCMMCSLLPGEDKLAFSVFWEMTAGAEIVGHRFCRTIVNSCTQLAYEHAQTMIESPDTVPTDMELPEIHGAFQAADVKRVVLQLQQLGRVLRERRFANGALTIQQPKIMFSLDLATFLPTAYSLYENKECHRLIEEFMLLANITVATHLTSEYPDLAFLRSHPAPHEHMTTNLKSTLETVGIHLDVESSGGLQQTLWKYAGDDYLSRARMLVLSIMCAKPMSRAHYFCAANHTDTADYWHYALNVPLYTHFTSPIRRYADIMVHRLLAGSLGYTAKPTWSVDRVIDIAGNCNKQKVNSKRAGEQSTELYLIHYIAQTQPVIEKAVVIDVKDNSFDAIIIETGYNVRIYLNNLEENVKYEFLTDDGQDSEEKKLRNLVVLWPEKNGAPILSQVIAMFSIITVTLTKKENAIKLVAKLVRPVHMLP